MFKIYYIYTLLILSITCSLFWRIVITTANGIFLDWQLVYTPEMIFKFLSFLIFVILLLGGFFLDFIYFSFRERVRNINVWLPPTLHLLGTWPTTQACALMGNWTCDPLLLRPKLNPLSYTSQGPFLLFEIVISNMSRKWKKKKEEKMVPLWLLCIVRIGQGTLQQ